jgi:phosphoribosylformylglycinamidine synthase
MSSRPAIIDIYPIIEDARIKSFRHKVGEAASKLSSVQIIDSYMIDAELSPTELEQAAMLLTNTLTEKFSANLEASSMSTENGWRIEIAFLPGVTDNAGNTAKSSIEDMLGHKFSKDEAVYSSQKFLVQGDLNLKDIQSIFNGFYNPLIQSILIQKASEEPDIRIPRVYLEAKSSAFTEVDLNLSDEELIKIGRDGITNEDGSRRGPLALELDYMKTIQTYFREQGRNPTDIELESIAQTWSEHCKHTIFADQIDDIKEGLYKTYIKGATKAIREEKRKSGKKDFCVSVFTDNSGVIEFDDEYLITHKVETHNSPSALDPFGGAITGIVGVNRDAIGCGMGAKPIANTYGFCFADPEDERPLYRDAALTQKMLSPKRIMEGVIAGVNVGGNCSGIPTVQGFINFDEGFRGKPLVFVGTLGLLPKQVNRQSSCDKRAEPGDYIVMVGGRVGQDGIHGATFSSVAMDSGSPATAVQIGDPITQKKLSDAIVKEARDLNLYNSITDNGAGGLSCSVAEMAREAGGCVVELDKVPLKYPNLEAWKIWISESQERMTLAIPQEKWQAFSALMKSRDVEATVIGQFTDSGNCVVKYQNQTLMDIHLEFLHNGLPKRHLQTSHRTSALGLGQGVCEGATGVYSIVNEDSERANNAEISQVRKSCMLDMLARLNIAGYEFISSQYDHEVQGSSVIKPLQGKGRVNDDIAVIKPVFDSPKAVLLSTGINPCYSDFSAYDMAASAIDSAIRAAIAGGANLDYLALLDNFCWCSANEPERLWQLKEAAKACYDYALIYSTPFISGKDSMFNDFKGFDENANPTKISISPTLLISAVAVLDDACKAVSMDLKFPGDLIYLIGDTYDELGGSEYFSYLEEKQIIKANTGICPKVTAELNKTRYIKFSQCTQQGLIASAISVSRGGFGVALCKAAMAGKLGIDIDLAVVNSRISADAVLFSESQGRLLASVAPQNQKAFESIMQSDASLIGKVTDSANINIEGFTQSTHKTTALGLGQGVCERATGYSSVNEDSERANNAEISQVRKSCIGRDKEHLINISIDEALEAYRSRFAKFNS